MKDASRSITESDIGFSRHTRSGDICWWRKRIVFSDEYFKAALGTWFISGRGAEKIEKTLLIHMRTEDRQCTVIASVPLMSGELLYIDPTTGGCGIKLENKIMSDALRVNIFPSWQRDVCCRKNDVK